MSLANNYGLAVEVPGLMSRLNESDADVPGIVQQLLQISKSEPRGEMALGKNVPFLYQTSGINCPLSIVYAIKRSLKSLASVVFTVKVNNALFLRCLLSEDVGVSASPVMDWIDHVFQKQYLSANHRMNTTEENAMHAGRLLSYDIVCTTTGSSREAIRIIESVLKIWVSSVDLGFICQSVIRKMLTLFTKVSKDKRTRILCKIEDSLGDVCTEVALSMVLNVRHLCKFPSFAQTRSEWARDLLSRESIESIVHSIDLTNVDSLLAFVVPYSLFASLLVEKREPEFSLGWTIFVARLVASGKAAPHLLLKLLETLLPESSGELDGLLLSGPVLNVLSRTRSLNDLAVKILASLSGSSHVHMGKHLLLSNHGLIFARALFSELSGDKAQGIIEELASHLQGSSMTCRYLDLILFVLKRKKPILQPRPAIQAALKVLCSNSDSRDALSCRVHNIVNVAMFSANAQSDNEYSTKEASVSETSLEGSLGAMSIEYLKDWLGYCNGIIDSEYNLDQKFGRRRFKALDQPVQDAWKSLLKLLPRIDKTLSKHRRGQEASLLAILEIVALAGKILLVLDPLAATSIVDDLTAVYEDLRTLMKKGEAPAERQLEPVDVLTEILIQWLSRPSSFLRNLSSAIFVKLLPRLTDSAYQSISKILTTPLEEVQEDLMEDEYDEHMESGEDEHVSKRKLDGDPDFIAHMPKRAKIESSEDSSESEAIDLDRAESAELELLDSQLASIMAGQKAATQSKATERESFVHFKLRICGLLELALVRQDDLSLQAKLRLLPAILEALRLHDASPGKGKGPAVQNLTRRLKAIFQRFYVQDRTGHGRESTQEESSCYSEVSSKLLHYIAENLITHSSMSTQLFQAFWFVASKTRAEHSNLQKDLLPLWHRLLQEGDKQHSSSFLSFFEMVRSRLPGTILQLVSSEESLLALSKARQYTRSKTLRFVEPIFHTCSRSQELTAFTPMVSFFDRAFAEGGFAVAQNTKQLKEELASICKFITKTRSFLGSEALDTWSPVLNRILDFLQQQHTLEKNQLGSLKARVLDCLNTLKLGPK